MAPALQIADSAYVNGYTGVSSNTQYWQSRQVYYPRYLTFSNEINHRSVQKNPSSPQQSLTKGTVHNSRNLHGFVNVDDGLDEISYPIAVTDTCDCVNFPSDGFTLDTCSAAAYWGTFEVKYTDGSCSDVSFDEARVYANCPSAMSSEAIMDYVLCVVDFTEGTDNPEALPTYDEVSDETTTADGTSGATSKKVASSDQTTGAAKKTRIHLSVHRLLTFVLEAVFALQAPST